MGQHLRDTKSVVQTVCARGASGQEEPGWAGGRLAFWERRTWAGLGQQSGGEDHVENSKQRAWCWLIWKTLQYLRRKADRADFNYLKDPCTKWALEFGWGIIATA